MADAVTETAIESETTINSTMSKALDTEEGAALQRQDLTQKAETCPDCGRSKSDAGDCHNDYHSTQKSVEDVDTTIPGDTTQPSSDGQDAGEATPESDEDQEAASEGTEPDAGQEADAATPEPDADESTEHTVEKAVAAGDVRELVRHVGLLVAEIGRLREANAALTEQVETSKSISDEVETAKAVIDTVMKMPLTRKAKDYIGTDLIARFPQYDPEVVRFLGREPIIQRSEQGE